MKIKWKEDGGAGSFSTHGPEADFAAKYDPEAIYDVSPETAERLLKSGHFEETTETTRRKKQKEENQETEVSEVLDKEEE